MKRIGLLVLLTGVVVILVVWPKTRSAATQIAKSSKARNTSPSVSATDSNNLVGGNAAFAFDLYQRLRAGDKNIIFSPYSISAALAMAYAGARGDTEKEMAKVLHFSLPQKSLHTAFNSLGLSLNQAQEEDSGGTLQLSVANALWAHPKYHFKSEYLDGLAVNYGAGVRLVDFEKDNTGAVRAVNEWVSQETKGKIQDILSSLDPNTVLVLANAIYFKDKWQNPFDDAKPGPFTLIDGSQATAQMMSETEHLRYASGSDWQAVELPYKSGRLSMVIILPELSRFEQFDASLNAKVVEDALKHLSSQRVELIMPKFKFEQETMLADTLKAMGMPLPFTWPGSDFSGMDGTYLLYITSVIHKAMVEVDEKGTEAAAATVVTGAPGAMAANPSQPIKMIIDHPFIFMIRDMQTGSVLFVGRVMNPKG